MSLTAFNRMRRIQAMMPENIIKEEKEQKEIIEEPIEENPEMVEEPIEEKTEDAKLAEAPEELAKSKDEEVLKDAEEIVEELKSEEKVEEEKTPRTRRNSRAANQQ